jgi:cystathionine beta-lyase/cystathionine gamma-synthase
MPEPSLGPTAPLVTPLYQSAVYAFPDLDALDRVYEGTDPGFVYARDGHPNAALLAADLARREAAAWCVVCASGMAAISAPLLALLGPGKRVVASRHLYGRTTTLLTQEFRRLGVAVSLVDTCDLDAVRTALATPAAILVVETLSNPLLRLADVPALAELCHAAGCLLMVDNTFATPTLFRPTEHGADLVVESLTKLIGGHSDLTLGAVCGRDPELLPAVNRAVSVWGMPASPFDCWLAQRGVATLDLRARAATANAAALADWLAAQAGVSRVVYPTRPDHPDRELAARLLPAGCGNMLCFELAGGREAVNRFLRRAPGVPFSPSLGHSSTTCSHPDTTSHRYESPAEKRRQGITDGLIRLSVGPEDLDSLRGELQQGLGA